MHMFEELHLSNLAWVFICKHFHPLPGISETGLIVLPPLRVQNITVTQDMTPSGVAKVYNNYLFGRAKYKECG